MSIKKKILLTMLGMASLGASHAFAGGVDEAQPLLVPTPDTPRYIYIQGNVGYADSNWRSVLGFVTPFYPTVSHIAGGFTAGLDAGMMFNRFLGMEVGGYYLPEASGASSGLFPYRAGNLNVNSWFAYAGGKLAVPLIDNFEVFGKVGGAYRDVNYQGSGSRLSGKSGYWTPIFGAGAQYGWSSWIVDAQYMRLPGYRQATPITQRAPAANLYTVGIGYRFNF